MASGKRKTKVAPGSLGISLICSVRGPKEMELRRLLELGAALRPAKRRFKWVWVDAGEGLARQLVEEPELKPMRAKALSAPAGSGDWERFCLVADQQLGAVAVLLPAGASMDAITLGALCDAMAAGADIVVQERPRMPWVAKAVQRQLWGLPGLDLGSPVAVKFSVFSALAQDMDRFKKFLGPRLIKKALENGLRVVQCEAKLELSLRNPFDYAGEGGGPLWQRVQLLVSALTGTIVVWMALQVLMPYSAFLGLTATTVGLLFLGWVLGTD